MTKRKYVWLVLSLLIHPLSYQTHTAAAEFGVVIYGATPAGLAAAISIARRNPERHIVLATPFQRVGGMMTNGLNHPDFRTFEARTGLFRELNQRVEQYFREQYGGESMQLADSLSGTHASSKVLQIVLNQMLAELPSITVVANHRLTDVQLGPNRILSVTLSDASESLDLPARFFIDATYEGDLMAAAGVEYRVGREGQDEYGESLAPVEPDDQVQGYNFRLTMTSQKQNIAPVPQPKRYRRENYLPLLRLIQDGTVKRVFGDPYRSLPGGIYKRQTPKLPNGKRDINDVSRSRVRLSLPNLSREWPEGSPETRQKIFDQHVQHNIGMLYFLQNDQAVPESIQADARRWGLCQDEFPDNQHLPEQLYVREARRMVGRYIFKQSDTERSPGTRDARAVFHLDSIAMGDYGPNCHGTYHEGPIIGGRHTGEFYQRAAPYQVPYGTLLPKSIDNLSVPVACSASHVGFCALRLEPIWMSLGQAAGEATELAIEQGVTLREVAPTEIQARLHETHTATIYTADVPEESTDFRAVQWWGSVGGLVAIDREFDDESFAYGSRGDQIIGQYYAAFQRHEIELAKPLSTSLRSAWSELCQQLGISDAQVSDAQTRRQFIFAAWEYRQDKLQ